MRPYAHIHKYDLSCIKCVGFTILIDPLTTYFSVYIDLFFFGIEFGIHM